MLGDNYEGNRKVNRNIDYYNLDMIIAVRIQDKFKKITKILSHIKSFFNGGYSQVEYSL